MSQVKNKRTKTLVKSNAENLDLAGFEESVNHAVEELAEGLASTLKVMTKFYTGVLSDGWTRTVDLPYGNYIIYYYGMGAPGVALCYNFNGGSSDTAVIGATESEVLEISNPASHPTYERAIKFTALEAHPGVWVEIFKM